MKQDAELTYAIDERLSANAWLIHDLPLCRLYLKDEHRFPWFLLVPRGLNFKEITDLSTAQRYQLIDEIDCVQKIILNHFNVEKINVGALGNIVQQLHIHVVGRIKDDGLWPHGLWQKDYAAVGYLTPPMALKEAIRESIQRYYQASSNA